MQQEQQLEQEIDRMTLDQFIANLRITMTTERCDQNPNMDDSTNMDHWRVKFTKLADKRATLTTYFSMGYGHQGKAPKAAEVLDCLASDASSVAQESFEEWCGNMGWDTDSRKAERCYKTIEQQLERLRRFLGEDALDTLLYHTERE